MKSRHSAPIVEPMLDVEHVQPGDTGRATQIFHRDGFVAIADALTREQLETLRTGANRVVAEQMAAGGRKVLNADICAADTGIAGPDGATGYKPVGLFYIGLSHKGGTFSRRHVFPGDRRENKRLAAEAALAWVKEYLVSIVGDV